MSSVEKESKSRKEEDFSEKIDSTATAAESPTKAAVTASPAEKTFSPIASDRDSLRSHPQGERTNNRADSHNPEDAEETQVDEVAACETVGLRFTETNAKKLEDQEHTTDAHESPDANEKQSEAQEHMTDYYESPEAFSENLSRADSPLQSPEASDDDVIAEVSETEFSAKKSDDQERSRESPDLLPDNLAQSNSPLQNPEAAGETQDDEVPADDHVSETVRFAGAKTPEAEAHRTDSHESSAESPSQNPIAAEEAQSDEVPADTAHFADSSVKNQEHKTDARESPDEHLAQADSPSQNPKAAEETQADESLELSEKIHFTESSAKKLEAQEHRADDHELPEVVQGDSLSQNPNAADKSQGDFNLEPTEGSETFSESKEKNSEAQEHRADARHESPDEFSENLAQADSLLQNLKAAEEPQGDKDLAQVSETAQFTEPNAKTSEAQEHRADAHESPDVAQADSILQNPTAAEEKQREEDLESTEGSETVTEANSKKSEALESPGEFSETLAQKDSLLQNLEAAEETHGHVPAEVPETTDSTDSSAKTTEAERHRTDRHESENLTQAASSSQKPRATIESQGGQVSARVSETVNFMESSANSEAQKEWTKRPESPDEVHLGEKNLSSQKPKASEEGNEVADERCDSSELNAKTPEESPNPKENQSQDSAEESSNGEGGQLQAWLKNMGLSQYYEIFVKRGYEYLDDVENIDENEYADMRVLRGHRRKIVGRLQSDSPRQIQRGDGKSLVKEFFANLKCAQHYEVFLKEGFEDMESLTRVKDDDLQSMLPLLPGHVKRIRKRLSSLKSVQDDETKARVVAETSYIGKTKNELSFSEGHTIVILEEYSDGRCKGILFLNGSEGVFPKAALGHSIPGKTSALGKSESEVIRRTESDQNADEKCHKSVIERATLAESSSLTRSALESSEADAFARKALNPGAVTASETKTLKQLAAGDSELSDTPTDINSSGSSAKGAGKDTDESRNSSNAEKGSETFFRYPRQDSDSALSVDQEGTSVDPTSHTTKKRTLPKPPSRIFTVSGKEAVQQVSEKHGNSEKDTPAVSNSESEADTGNTGSDERYYDARGEENEELQSNSKDVLGVHVTFHALLHSEWNWKEDKKFVIRFGNTTLGNWNWNTITMEVIGTMSIKKEKFLHLCGSFVLPTELTSVSIRYKYALASENKRKKNISEWEHVRDGAWGGIVNRLLLLPKRFHGLSKGVYVKYDDVIRKKPGILQYFNSPRSAESREIAIRAFFPKWPGFYRKDSRYILTPWRANEALREVFEVATQLSSLFIQEDGANTYTSWRPHGFKIQRVLATILKPKISELRDMNLTDSEIASERLVSAIAIAVVVSSFQLQPTPDQLGIQDFHTLAAAFALLPDLKSRECISLDIVSRQFTDLNLVSEAIRYVCVEVCQKYDPEIDWIIAVPLFHFVSEVAKPFQLPQKDWRKDREWWGLDKLESSATLFRTRSKKRLHDSKEKLLPLIVLDPLLFRAIAYASPLEQLVHWISVAPNASDALVALLKRVQLLGFGSHHSTNQNLINTLRDTLELLIVMFSETQMDSLQETYDSTKIGIQASLELFKLLEHRSLRRTERDIYRNALDLLLTQLRVFDKIVAPCSLDKRRQMAEWSEEILHTAATLAVDWIERTTVVTRSRTHDSVRSDVQLWSDMLCTDIVRPVISQPWSAFFTKRLTDTLEATDSSLVLEVFSSLQNAQLHPLIIECFLEVTEAAVKKLADKDPEQAFHSLSTPAKSGSTATSDHSRNLLQSLLIRNTPAEEDTDRKWLESILSWPLWRHYFRHAGDLFPTSSSGSVVSSTLDLAASVFSRYALDLAHGQITVTDFALVEKNQRRFLDICGVLHEAKWVKDRLKRNSFLAIEERSQEWKRFIEERNVVINFVNICQALGNVSLEEISTHSSRDVSSLPMNRLARRDDSGEITVSYFELPDEIWQYMKPLSRLRTSTIFQQLWRDQGSRVIDKRATDDDVAGRPMTLMEFVHLVIEPVLGAWDRICSTVKEGKIVLAQVKEYFRIVLDDSAMLEAELKLMESDHSNQALWVAQRVKQISLYNTLSNAVDSARAVACVCEQLGVSEPFPAVDEIRRQDSDEFRQEPISSITSDLVSAGKFLAKMTPEQIRCLHRFAGCGDLITWVREEIKEWKELETFVELAGTRSSSEGDFEATKVAALRAACAGFAPLLFDLNEDFNLDQLLTACGSVFDKLERDKLIPQKWSDTEKFLEDFKIMKESLGSVEVSSFSQVEVINSRGEYTVGCLSTSTPGDIGDCISLRIKPSALEGSSARKTFSLTDLQDLQSKLILISGHSGEQQSEVNVFVNTLESVTRLALNLVALCKAGHVKYLSWKQMFDCVKSEDFNRAASARLEILRNQMKQMEDEMEKDLGEWKAKMIEVRSKFYYLNYFTTSQLLMLGKHLGELALDRESELDNFVYGLLECIKPNINVTDVKTAMGRAIFKPSRRRQTSAAGLRGRSSFGGGVPLSQASFGGNETLSTFGRDASIGGLSSAGSVPHAKFGAPVGRTETKLERESLQDFPTFNADNDSYLSLEKLGEFLQSLAAQNAPRPPTRSFPSDQLEFGSPNLIVVPQAELIPTVLQLYMADPLLPLPSAEEVLLCSRKTTLETVSLFWRRAIKDPSQSRLFCLAGADHLSYEVSREAFDEFLKISQGLSGHRGEKYRLVVICSTENEDKSYMVSALDHVRRLPLPCPTPQEVQSYLKTQFQRGPACLKLRTAIGSMWEPAAKTLDHEKCCVRVVYSTRAGVGKSLFVSHISEKLRDISNNEQARSYLSGEEDPLTKVIVPLHELAVDTDAILDTLEPAFPHPQQALSRLIHIDVSPSVRRGLEELLFNLLILGQIADSKGRVWRRRLTDMYVLECTWPEDQSSVIEKAQTKEGRKHIPFEYFLPAIARGSPKEALELLEKRKNPTIGDPSLDGKEFGNSNFQRAFQYLVRFVKGKDLDSFNFKPETKEGTPPICLQTLLAHCGVPSPSWAILRHFVHFLSNQLRDCERSDFCNPEAYEEDLPGFKNFVMKLVIKMSRDFSTPSLSADLTRLENTDNLQQYELRRKWEQSPHPYLFFNEDRHSMTPIGLRITREGYLMDTQTAEVLDEQIMSPELSMALYTQQFRLQESSEEWPKERKIKALCDVMGLDYNEDHDDPDPGYELTADNVIKILAIHMRFRCGIPVVVMGETGCGKTRLIRYMCLLQALGAKGPKTGVKVQTAGLQNMLLMKVHGGVTRADIIQMVIKAEACAEKNAKFGVKTVLFFDEANTTDAVGLIKEIMCDKRVNGRCISQLGSDLHVIASCNPYRQHTEVMIQKLESAGLGYHVRTGDTEDRLGDIPLRQLVYRVHPLPESMKALVWDFGQLNQASERLYIRQIVRRYVLDGSLPNLTGIIDVATSVLAASQSYMRDRNDECSFVSLRDVERAMMVMVWFYKLNEVLDPFMTKMYDGKKSSNANDETQPLDPLTRSLVLALGVSYQARLHDRKPFQEAVSHHFRAPCSLPGSASQMKREIEYCQTVFLDELELPPKVGRNHALKENVFMMVVCIDLRIPLFLVGKPGSSKSLAKDVVKNAMRGDLSSSALYKHLKHAHMVSYQCSPLSTADGIISTFTQCQRIQDENDLERFVACVVLDEVGLAEDSPRLPLKALHPLLDDGTVGADNNSKESKESDRVAFVGISNWALDPAKMNRGILVQRALPTSDELVVSAFGICSTDENTKNLLQAIIPGMANAYLEIYNNPTRQEEREFFGLRDFYSLVKMLFSFCKFTGKRPSEGQLIHAIRRNFGGLDGIDPEEIFSKYIAFKSDDEGDDELVLDSSPAGLIRANLNKTGQQESEESRYLLLLTENYAALTILRQRFLVGNEDPVIIFGSSFSKDQEYTQICRNINRVKVCMATGRTVVLLNLDKLYESLYDALNQYYVYHGGQRFVDLGLGSHRVKCQVHKNFRLILIADQEAVYRDFPIPLINRMEKHFLAMSSILTPRQQRIVADVDRWVNTFAQVVHVAFREEARKRIPFKAADAFVGYHPDAAATVVLRICHLQRESDVNVDEESDEAEKRLFTESCYAILECAAPDAVARLPMSGVRKEASELWDAYFKKQTHSSLADYLCSRLTMPVKDQLIQVTTHSRLLSNDDVNQVGNRIRVSTSCISLQQFDTEQNFFSRVTEFYSQGTEDSVLIVLCESGDVNGELVACARYLVQECRENACNKREKDGLNHVSRHVVFVIHLPRVAGGCFVGFQGGAWSEVHIDDLRPANQAKLLSIASLVGRKLSTLLGVVEPGPPINQESIDVETDVDRELPKEESVLSTAVLLRSCVHAATSRLDDPAGSPLDAANIRLSLLLRLIPEDETSLTGVPGFYVELKRRVTKLLSEREQRAGEKSACDWVKNEALIQNSIQAGGTFRHSLWLKIVTVVTPILAELIAFVDADANLSLLEETARGAANWVGDLWLKLFASPQLTQLRYDEFLSPTEQTPRHRVLVKGSGHHNHFFQAHFPFSRLIKDEVDGMIKHAEALAGREHARLADALQRLFDGSSVGKIVQKSSVKSVEEMARLYLHDFVHMVHNSKGKIDFELVFYAILSGFNEMTDASFEQDNLTQEGAPPADVLTIPTIHAAYEAVKFRLNLYEDLTRLEGGIVATVYQQLGSAAGKEMKLDTVAFTVFLENLQPKPNELSFETSRLAWLLRVQEARPCVESWLALSVEGLSTRAAPCGEAQNIWTKICTVRLYFEHIKSIGKSVFAVGAGERLWKCFENHDTDFGSVRTVDLILRFLNETSQDCCERLFGHNGGECIMCQNAFKDPVELPCGHIFCLHCIRGWLIEDHRTCPNCRTEVPEQFNLHTSEKLIAKSSNFVLFKACCTGFFMELVAVYSFSEQARNPPQPDLVRLLMDLITQRRAGKDTKATRALSPFRSDAIDASPTVRSFLLQLLLRYSSHEAMDHVLDYFERTRRAVREHAYGDVLQQEEEELGVIFVQCFEDSIARATSQGHIVFVERLKFAVQNLQEDQHSLCYLQAVASARYGLCFMAEVILDLVDSAEEPSEVEAVGLELVHQLCTSPYDKQILFFLLKQLVKRRGNGVLSQLQNVYELTWLENLVVEHAKNDEEVIPDYFVGIGDAYISVRKGVTRAILTESGGPIDAASDELVHQNVKKNHRAILVLLALYREVTMRRVHTDCDRHVTGKMQAVLEDYCSAPGLPPWAQDIGNRLLNNALTEGNLPVLVSPGQSLQRRAAAAVALHVLLVIEAAADDPLMKPFRYMLKDSSRLAKSYIPTMPEDNFSAVRDIAHGDIGTAWHECPNGHPYFIDDCGGAVTDGNCFCGAAIGGVDYDLLEDNVRKLRENDATETGHILGPAAARSDSAVPERGLPPAYCALIRVLMHASLMWGSCDMQLSRAIAEIVEPPLKVDQLPQFFWDHFEKDLRAFAKAIGYTPDDASVVLHWFLDYLVSKQQHAVLVGDGTLTSKAERQNWESDFARHCIEPALREARKSAGQWLKNVVNDERVGNNPLMRWLYEIEAPPGAQSPASLWRYRAQVTVEDLTAKLDHHVEDRPEDRKLVVLREFLKEERNLRALQFLPQILQLQRMLLERFHRRLGLNEAATFSVDAFLRSLQERERQVYTRLISVFDQIWTHVGHEILSHGRLKPKKEEDKLMQVTGEMSIAFLLPTTTGKGSCAMSLVDYLINCVHNEFVSRFRNLSGIEGKIPKVSMNEITRAQLISYDFERDFFPLMLAHCNYSLEVGKGSDVTYDFAALQRQLIDRFLSGKPRIVFKPHQFVFSQHAYTEALFGRIEQKIPQEKLSITVSRQIIKELRELTQVYSVLSDLDVLIGFIVSTGGERECLIHEYLHGTLRMPEDRGLVSAKARQYCRLKHTLSLWRLLMVEKGKRLVLSHRDPFEDFPDAYKEELNPDLQRRFVESLRKIDLDSFMHDLVQLAWLEVKNKIETQGLEEYPLGEAMEDLCYSKLKGLREIPEEVQLRHLMQCWSIAVELQASLEQRKE